MSFYECPTFFLLNRRALLRFLLSQFVNDERQYLFVRDQIYSNQTDTPNRTPMDLFLRSHRGLWWHFTVIISHSCVSAKHWGVLIQEDQAFPLFTNGGYQNRPRWERGLNPVQNRMQHLKKLLSRNRVGGEYIVLMLRSLLGTLCSNLVTDLQACGI